MRGPTRQSLEPASRLWGCLAIRQVRTGTGSANSRSPTRRKQLPVSGGASEAHRNGWRALSAMIVAGVGVAAAAILGDAVFVVEEDQTDGERAEREESN